MSERRRAGAVLAAIVAVLGIALPLAAQAKVEPHECPPCSGMGNAYIRADVSEFGYWALGTTGGDPNTPDDNNRDLLYDYRPGGTSRLGSSYVTVRVTGAQGTRDLVPARSDVVAQAARPDYVSTTWLFRDPSRVRVTQTLAIVLNPFSGRPDAVDIALDATNEDASPYDLGLRALLDVQIADNDGAPYYVPGVGAIVAEREFRGIDVPPFWLAFASDIGDPRELRGVGILDSAGLTRPDRAIIAYWKDIRNLSWDYAVTPTKAITLDSAVALFWDPAPLAPGASRHVSTRYGLAGQGSGEAFVVAENPRCGMTLPVSLFIRNFSTEALTAGTAALSLPPGIALAPGEMATRSIADIPAGGTGSVVWRVAVGPTTSGVQAVSAEAGFAGGRRFTASSSLQVECVLPTATPSPTPTPARATPTATSPAPPTPTPEPGGNACDFIRNRVPPAVVSYALANPTRIQGWNELANPKAPPGPANPPRRWLSIQNVNRPFHPFYNTVVFKAGCP